MASNRRSGAGKVQTESLFALSQQTLDALASATGLAVLDEAPQVESDHKQPLPSTQLSCLQTCLVASFDSVQAMRQHFKTDWHRYNLARRLRSLPPVSEDAFEELTELSSIDASSDDSASADELDDADERKRHRTASSNSVDLQTAPGASRAAHTRRTGSDDDDDRDDASDEDGPMHTKGSPFVTFVLRQHGSVANVNGTPSGQDGLASNEQQLDQGSDQGVQQEQLLVYKQALAHKHVADESAKNPAFWVQQVHSCQASKLSAGKNMYWTLIMLGSGHFAGSVIDCRTGKHVVHKTFHRYTTRKKQGGAQGSNDSAKGKAKSAGAGIRRYNEAALRDEVRDLLETWRPYLDASQVIFLRATANNRKTVYHDGGVLLAKDPRIRSYPFTTRRPTLAELQRCFEELSTVRLQVVSVANDAESAAAAKAASAAKLQAQQDQQQRQQQQQQQQQQQDAIALAQAQAIPAPSERMAKLLDVCKRGKLELLKSMLETAEAGMVNGLVHEKHGTSLLHVASASGHADIVKMLLELGADPTLHGETKVARAYDVAQSKDVRDAFRRYMAAAPDAWNYADAHVPGPLTAEMEEKQKEKEREKERRRKELEIKNAPPPPPPEETPALAPSGKPARGGSRPGSSTGGRRFVSAKLSKTQVESIGMSPEQRARLDREKRALAAEARMRTQQNKCSACSKSLEGLTPFEKQQFRYCSTECVQKHKVLF